MDGKLFNIGKHMLLLFLIIYVGSLISWFFTPVIVAFNTIFIPLIISGFLFYLFRPFVNLLNKKIPRVFSILLIYVVMVGLIVVAVVSVGPILQQQIVSFTNNIPKIFREIQAWVLDLNIISRITQLEEGQSFINIDDYIQRATEALDQISQDLITSLGKLLGTMANVAFVIVLIPFLLFYSLKDSHKFTDTFVNFFSRKQKSEVRRILQEIDATISSYIQGQGLICLFVGLLCLITFLIIGLDYALLLAIIAGITNIIPYFGPWIGSVPAVIVGLFMSPLTALITIIAVIIIQQIESNIIAPQVMSKKLRIHPVTIIFLILIAGQLLGLIGMIIAVPFYATSRVLLIYGHKLWRVRKKILQN